MATVVAPVVVHWSLEEALGSLLSSTDTRLLSVPGQGNGQGQGQNQGQGQGKGNGQGQGNG